MSKRFVFVSGSHADIGFQLGRHLGDRIRRALQSLDDELAVFTLPLPVRVNGPRRMPRSSPTRSTQ